MNFTSDPASVRKLLLSVWEYAGELVLAGLLCLLVFIRFEADQLQRTLCRLRPDLLTGISVVLGLSVAIWIGLLTILSSDFGAWLRKKVRLLHILELLLRPFCLTF